LISWSSSTASSTPATSLKPIFGESGVIRFARDLPKLITFECRRPGVQVGPSREIPEGDGSPERKQDGRGLSASREDAEFVRVELDVLFPLQQVLEN
jgi:hypothetical protein